MAELDEKTPQDDIAERLKAIAGDIPALFNTIGELCCSNEENGVVSALTVLARVGCVNISALVSSLSRDKCYSWFIGRVLACVLARTDVVSQEFLQEVRNIVRNSEGRIDIVNLCDAVTDYCFLHPNEAPAVVDACLALTEVKERSALLLAGLIGMAKENLTVGHSRCLNLMQNSDPFARREAILALGFLDYGGNVELLLETERRFACLLDADSVSSRVPLATAISRLQQRVPSDTLASLLLSLCHDPDTEVGSTILSHLWMSFNDHGHKEWHRQCVEALLRRPTSSVAELDSFDHLISQMLRKDTERALESIELWAQSQPNGTRVKALRSVASHLESRHELLSRCLTRWFNSNCRNLHALAAFLVQYHVEHAHNGIVEPLLLDRTELASLSVFDVRFLLGKIVGHCFAYEKAVVSLVFSVLVKVNVRADVDALVIDMFGSLIAINYPGCMDECLKKAKGSRQRRVAASIRSGMRKYFDALTSLPVLKECQQSDEHRQKVRTVERARDNRVMKEAQEASVLKLIAHSVMIKHGQAFFTDEGGEELTGRKMTLGTPTPFVRHSFTAEMPRHIILDPLGLEWRLHCYRGEARTGGAQ